MALGTYLVLEALPQYLAVAGMFTLAAALVWIDIGERAHRVFALFLVLRGTSMLLGTFEGLARDAGAVEATSYWAGVGPYFSLAVPFVVVYFACVYVKPRWWLGNTRLGGVTLLAAAVAAQVAYVLDHGLWAEYGIAPSGRWAALDLGPLSAALGLVFLTISALSLVYARDYLQMGAGPRRRSLFFVVAGFTLTGLFDGSLALFSLISNAWDASIIVDLRALALLPPLAAMGLLARHARGTMDEPADWWRVRRLLLVAPLPVASAALPFLLPGTPNVFLVLTGLWRLAFPALVTYALVRHQLFGIDLTIKTTVKRSTVGGAFVMVFFIVSEGAEVLVATRWGQAVGLAAAGLLTVALDPLRNVGERAAERVMPGVEDTDAYREERRFEVYRGTLERAIADGQITDREREILDGMQESLGLEASKAEAIEREVVPGGLSAG